MTAPPYQVLFLCTGNSARSILAEAILNQEGGGRFKAHSAGSHPKGQVHPLALERLRMAKLPTAGLHSKSWDEFAAPGAAELDFVFTVCDRAAREACPSWPGQPLAAHWGIPDPAAVEGTDAVMEDAFRLAFQQLQTRINLLVSLRLESLQRFCLQQQLQDIGRTADQARAVQHRLADG
jgi:arsenate reductase